MTNKDNYNKNSAIKAEFLYLLNYIDKISISGGFYMSIKFLTDIVDNNDKLFTTTTFYEMMKAIQPLYADKICLVSKDDFNPVIPEEATVVILQDGCTKIPTLDFDTTNMDLHVIAPNSITALQGLARNEGRHTIIYFYGTASEWDNVSKPDFFTFYDVEIEEGFPLIIYCTGNFTNGEEEEE